MADNRNKPLSEKEKLMEDAVIANRSAVAEIERRKNARDTLSKDEVTNEMFAPNMKANPIKNSHGYDFAVINKTHVGMRPPCERPGFRILGLFRENDGEFNNWLEDVAGCKAMYEVDGTGKMECTLGDLHKLPLGKYGLLSKTHKKDQSESYVLNKIDELKALHLQNMRMSKREFEDNRLNKREGASGLSLDNQRQKAKEKRSKSCRNKAIKTINNNATKRKEVGRIPKSLQLNQQEYAVIIVMHDITDPVLQAQEDPEPAIMVIDTFGTCDEAIEYIETLKDQVLLMNIDVVTMYVWNYPEDVKYDEIEEKYRNPEQNMVMQGQKNARKDIRKAEYEAKILGQKVPVTEVVVDRDTPPVYPENPLSAYDVKQNPNFSYDESVNIDDLTKQLEKEAEQLDPETKANMDQLYNTL